MADFGRVLSQYADVIVVRTFRHQTAVDLAQYSTCAVINGLTDFAHPCQALADLYTLKELIGRLQGHTLAYIGDGNNVAHSLAEGCGKVGMRFVMATPEGYRFDDAFRAIWSARCRNWTSASRSDPAEAVRGAPRPSIPTCGPAWGRSRNRPSDARRFAGYQVNDRLMAEAPEGALFMHCLPAHRGEEVTDEVIDGPQSVVVQQAANRLHVQKGVLAWILGAQR